MTRLSRLALLLVLAALVAPAAASAAPRMWMGFQDDPYFRWLPERFFMRDRAVHANSTIMKTTVYWFNTAPRRPANATNPFDPAYRWEDLDEFVRQAADRDIEVMLTIWGTPTWAGPAKNRLPRRLADIQNFARALANRYSGRNRGYPFVRFYSVWNEPNLNLFLTPQFDAKGRSVAPANYAKLYRAAYTGFKQGSPLAQVAIGETSARGRDRHRAGVSDTHSPGKFAELLAKARPKLRFDAYAHHPYSSPANQPPTQIVRWPNVSMTTLPRFGVQLDKWFGRKNIPIWLTEYGHETRPEDPKGVTYAQQASYLRTAVDHGAPQPARRDADLVRDPRQPRQRLAERADDAVRAREAGVRRLLGARQAARRAERVRHREGRRREPRSPRGHDEARLPQRRGLARRAHVQGLPEGPPARRRAAGRADRDRRLDHDPAAVHACPRRHLHPRGRGRRRERQQGASGR